MWTKGGNRGSRQGQPRVNLQRPTGVVEWDVRDVDVGRHGRLLAPRRVGLGERQPDVLAAESLRTSIRPKSESVSSSG